MSSERNNIPSKIEIAQVLRVALYLTRKVLRWMTWGTSAMLVLVVSAFHVVGHSNPTVAFMLYLPPWVWAIPSVILLLPGVCFDFRRSGLPCLVALLLYLGPGLGFSWQIRRQSVKSQHMSIGILTYNRGQSQGTSLQPFMAKTVPDIVAIQDAGGRADQYHAAPGYHAYTHVAGEGEFTLLSRFPITSSKVITAAAGMTGTPIQVAARFELQGPGKRAFVVYSVHLPTHRGMLLSERGGGFLAGIVGLPGTPWAEKRRSRELYWQAAMNRANDLARQIREEELPVIVVGDFNAPPFGPMYRAFSSFLKDSHSAVGTGYGFTFPGQTANPFALMRPWLRIDYVMYSHRPWRAITSVTEPDRSSQHRAVYAQLEYADEP